MFRSARLKLTLFYLAILLGFSLILTSSLRVLAENEYNNSNLVQRSEFKRLALKQVYGFDPSDPSSAFTSVQDDQAALVRQHLNEQFAVINLLALAVGGVLSYWFAGRTLRPIEAAHEAQARFAADASHELRTPLTNIRLENEVFLRQKHFSEVEAREQLASNLEEVCRLESLSSSLLDLTRYGRAALALEPVDISRVVAGAVEQAQKTVNGPQAQIEVAVESATVNGHSASLKQLIDILLDNAAKYGPEKGKIVVQGKPQDSQYVLTVSDEGPGISEDDLPRIFDRLYRGDKARSSKVSGYGLGLSLAQAIARANAATLNARNNAQQGATFELRLELAKQHKSPR